MTRALLLCLVVLGASPSVSGQGPEPPGHAPEPVPSDGPGPEAEVGQVTAPVVLDRATLFQVRGARGYPAEERARAISDRIEAVARTPSIEPGSVKAVPADGVVNLTADDRYLMAVTDVDARPEGLDRRALARIYSDRIMRGVRSYREARSPAMLLQGAKRSALATAVLLFALALLVRGLRSLEARVLRRFEARIRSLQYQSFEILRAQRLRDLLRWLLRALRFGAVVILAYLWLELVLESFPVTRPLSERMLGLALDPLARLGAALIAEVPNLVFLLVLFLLVRWLLRLTRLFFEAVEKGHVTLPGFEPEWALPTFRVVRLLALALAVVVAYPYIPGSRSAAFQGLSILFGVMLSIGSSSFIANIIAGYSMIYRRAFRVGDRIRAGDVVGDVTAMRLQVTHVRSIKNEEIVLPNSTLLASHVVNYSTLAQTRGLILHTTIGIGYETPWRQVEAMLLMAADRTPGLVRDLVPFVIPKSLGDFCIVYELNVYCNEPAQMGLLYGRLHRSILDVFNEYSVQIMTPAYEGDPDTPKVVPKNAWWTAPARPAEPQGSTGV